MFTNFCCGLLLLSLISLQNSLLVETAKNESSTHQERQKRGVPLLLFPPTSPTRTQWIIGIGIPLEDLLFEAMTTGYVFKAEYYLPTTVKELQTKNTHPITVRKLQSPSKFEQFLAGEGELGVSESLPQLMQNGKKVLASYRWSVYKGLEGLANRIGLSGRACILKSICEAAEIPFDYRNGLFGELLYILLTPSSSVDELSEYADNDYFHAESMGHSGADCGKLFENCHKSLLHHFSDVHAMRADITRILG